MSRENVEVVREAYDAVNRGDMLAWRELADPAVEFIDHNPAPDGSGRLQGRDALEAYLRNWMSEFDDFQARVKEFIPVGDQVVCAVTWHGRGKGSDALVEWHGADIVTVQNGLVLKAESGYPTKEAALEAVGLRE